MSGFAAWGLTVLGLATVTTIAEMLLPHGKLRNVILSVFASITALVIITPIPELFKNGFDFDFSTGTVATDSDYLDFIDKSREDIFAASAVEYLKQHGYDGGFTLTVTADGYTVKTVTVKFDESGMTADGGHINKSEIVGLIAEYFGVGREAVMTYG